MWLKVPYRQCIINTDNISHFYRTHNEIYACHIGGEISTRIASYIDEPTAQRGFQGMLDRNFEYVGGDTYKLSKASVDQFTVKVQRNECRIKRKMNLRRQRK
jgi:hypothetical protein